MSDVTPFILYLLLVASFVLMVFCFYKGSQYSAKYYWADAERWDVRGIILATLCVILLLCIVP
jgi:uncharacterized membrane protein